MCHLGQAANTKGTHYERHEFSRLLTSEMYGSLVGTSQNPRDVFQFDAQVQTTTALAF